MWPHVRDWAQALWEIIEDERGHLARPALDEELDDVGGGG